MTRCQALTFLTLSNLSRAAQIRLRLGPGQFIINIICRGAEYLWYVSLTRLRLSELLITLGSDALTGEQFTCLASLGQDCHSLNIRPRRKVLAEPALAACGQTSEHYNMEKQPVLVFPEPELNTEALSHCLRLLFQCKFVFKCCEFLWCKIF